MEDPEEFFRQHSSGVDSDEAAARERAKRLLQDFIKVKARSTQLERQLATVYQENEGLIKLLQDKRYELSTAHEQHAAETKGLKEKLAATEARLDGDSWENWNHTHGRDRAHNALENTPASAAPMSPTVIGSVGDLQRKVDTLALRLIEVTRGKAEAEAAAAQAQAEAAHARGEAEMLRQQLQRAKSVARRASILPDHSVSSATQRQPDGRLAAPPPLEQRRPSAEPNVGPFTPPATPLIRDPALRARLFDQVPESAAFAEGAHSRNVLRRGVLVAIDYTGQADLELQGSVGASGRVAAMLRTAGSADGEVVRLSDNSAVGDAVPTRENILGCLEWLTSGLSPGDTVLFYFVGHGGSLEDDAVEAVVPVDFEDQGGVSSTDVMGFLSVVPEGASVLLLCDCRHTGTMLELPYQLAAVQGESQWRQPRSSTLQRLAADVTVISTSTVSQQTSGGQEGALTNAFTDFVFSSGFTPQTTFHDLLVALDAGLRAQGVSADVFPQIARSALFNPGDSIMLAGGLATLLMAGAAGPSRVTASHTASSVMLPSDASKQGVLPAGRARAQSAIQARREYSVMTPGVRGAQSLVVAPGAQEAEWRRTLPLGGNPMRQRML
eukprot:Hpha_TRINITY_DN20046_c0_g1::TRINITY_DN20046_c0_g1_i1::g.147703::m.147703